MLAAPRTPPATPRQRPVYNHSFIVIPVETSGFAYSVVAGSLDNSVASTVTTPAGLVAGVAAGVTYLFATTALSSLAVALKRTLAYSSAAPSV